MLNPDRSCRAAVKRIAAWLSFQGKKLANDEDDPYIKARRRLPKTVPIRLLKHIGRRCHERASPGWQKSTRHRRAILGFAQQEPRPACHGRGFGAALVYSIDGGLLVRSNKLRIRPTTAQPPRMAASPTNWSLSDLRTGRKSAVVIITYLEVWRSMVVSMRSSPPEDSPNTTLAITPGRNPRNPSAAPTAGA
jgi:hypothetical protein